MARSTAEELEVAAGLVVVQEEAQVVVLVGVRVVVQEAGRVAGDQVEAGQVAEGQEEAGSQSSSKDSKHRGQIRYRSL